MSHRLNLQDATGILATIPGAAGAIIACNGTVTTANAYPADNSAGYEPGCLFISFAGLDVGVVYINRGTNSACLFKAVPAFGSDTSLGTLTITTKIIQPRATSAAAGSTNADATALSHGYNSVTAADGTVGSILPTMVAGEQVFVTNTNGSSVLKVYPFAGAAIDALTATTGSYSLAATKSAIFFCDSSTQIYAMKGG